MFFIFFSLLKSCKKLVKQPVQLRRILRFKAHTACHLYGNLHRLILELIPLLRDGNYEYTLILIIALSCYKPLLLKPL